MWLIIIGAIVNLLVFFFEQWWKNQHPTRPTAMARQEFVNEVGKLKYFWMGSKRKQYAAALFDKFQANYDANPPQQWMSSVLNSDQASALAKRYAEGLSLDKDGK